MIRLIRISALILLALAVGAVNQTRERTRWPIPTYTIEIRGVEANDFSVTIEGSFTRPAGKVIEVEKRSMRLPVNFYLNADCPLDLVISTTEKRFRSTLFYEHNEVTKWLSTADGIPGVDVTYKLPARK